MYVKKTKKETTKTSKAAKQTKKTSKNALKESDELIKKTKKTSKKSLKKTIDDDLVVKKTSKAAKAKKKVTKETIKPTKTTKVSKKSLKDVEVSLKEPAKTTKKTSKKTVHIDKLTEKIASWCDKMGIKRYEILENHEIDAWGYVDLKNKIKGELPDYIQFNHIHKSLPFFHADFDISGCELKTLRGCPRHIEGNFYIQNNKLKSLEYAPLTIGSTFVCYDNPGDFTKQYIEQVSNSLWVRTSNASLFDDVLPSKKQTKKTSKKNNVKDSESED